MHARVFHISEMIKAEPWHDWTVAAMAAEVGISPQHFARQFRYKMGSPPHAYVTEHRLKMACELLSVQHPIPSIDEVAVKCGFPNANNFARVFKQHNGLTPTEFRALSWEIHQSNSQNDDK